MFDLSKIFDLLSKKFALPDTLLRSKNYFIDSSHIWNFQLSTKYKKKSKMESITNFDTVLLTRLLSEMPWDLRKFQIEHSHGCCWM